MASGFFLGGASQGFNQAREAGIQQQQVDQQGNYQTKILQLKQKEMENQQHREMFARSDKARTELMSTIKETIAAAQMKALADGQPFDIDKTSKHLMPLVQQAAKNASLAGIPNGSESVMAQFAAMLAAPPDVKAGLDITELRKKIATPVVSGEGEDDLLGTKTKQYSTFDTTTNRMVPTSGGNQNLTSGTTTGASVQNIGPDGKPTGPQQAIDVNPNVAGEPTVPQIDPDVKKVMPANPLGVSPTKNPVIQKLAARGLIDPVTFDFRALRLLGGDKSQIQGSGYGKVGPLIRNALQTRSAELSIDMGISPGEANARVAGYSANTASLKTLVGQKNAIESFSENELQNMHALVQMADKVDTTGRPVLERWIRAGRRSVAGDPDVAAFDFQMQLVRNGVAKIVSNPNMTGVLTVDQVNELRESLPNASSAKQIRKIVETAAADFGRRHKSIDDQIAKVNKAFGDLSKVGGEKKTAPTKDDPLGIR